MKPETMRMIMDDPEALERHKEVAELCGRKYANEIPAWRSAHGEFYDQRNWLLYKHFCDIAALNQKFSDSIHRRSGWLIFFCCLAVASGVGDMITRILT
jgi:hypothetical protein